MGGTGLEPVTPSLSSWCSPNWANRPGSSMIAACGRSEDLGAPGGAVGREDHVGSRRGAPSQFLHPPAADQLREGEPAEVGGREGADVAPELRGGRRPLGTASAEPPCAGVPRAELVADVDHDRAVACI